MRSERHGDFVVDRGAQFIASSYRNMRALVDELGLKSRCTACTGAARAARRPFVATTPAQAILRARPVGALRLPGSAGPAPRKAPRLLPSASGADR
jgi:hypothetical protein